MPPSSWPHRLRLREEHHRARDEEEEHLRSEDDGKEKKNKQKIVETPSEFGGGKSAVADGREGGAGVDAVERDTSVGENGGKNVLLHRWEDEYIYSSGRLWSKKIPPLIVIRDWLEEEK